MVINQLYNSFFIFIFSMLFMSCNGQCNNDKASEMFLKNIDIVEQYTNTKSVNLNNLSSSVSRLETITKINSESDGNYIGQFEPTKEDLKKWKDWYILNKINLCWNEEKQEIYTK